jgi:hypothetical protein
LLSCLFVGIFYVYILSCPFLWFSFTILSLFVLFLCFLFFLRAIIFLHLSLHLRGTPSSCQSCVPSYIRNDLPLVEGRPCHYGGDVTVPFTRDPCSRYLE